MTGIDLTLRALHHGELQPAGADGRTARARREAAPPTTGGPSALATQSPGRSRDGDEEAPA